MGKALIDMGANINLMSLSMCQRIRNMKVFPTRMTLQLTDCSIIRLYGVVEDVLINVASIWCFDGFLRKKKIAMAY